MEGLGPHSWICLHPENDHVREKPWWDIKLVVQIKQILEQMNWAKKRPFDSWGTARYFLERKVYRGKWKLRRDFVVLMGVGKCIAKMERSQDQVRLRRHWTGKGKGRATWSIVACSARRLDCSPCYSSCAFVFSSSKTKTLHYLEGFQKK